METIKRDDFKEMKLFKRLVLPYSNWRYFSPLYQAVIFTLFILLLILQNATPTEKGIGTTVILVVWVFIGINIWIRNRQLEFKSISIALKREDFKTIVPLIGHELKWDLSRITQDYIIAFSKSAEYDWLKRVTIIRTKDEILINIISIPGNRPWFGSGGIKKNYGEIFEQHIQHYIERDFRKDIEDLIG